MSAKSIAKPIFSRYESSSFLLKEMNPVTVGMSAGVSVFISSVSGISAFASRESTGLIRYF